MSVHELGGNGAFVSALLVAWFLLTIPHQFTNKYGQWVKKINHFALIPGWTFFAPTPGTSNYRFVFRDLDPTGYTEWKEIEWCRGRRLVDAMWHPQRHRTKLIVDCVSAFSLTVQEMSKLGMKIDDDANPWMISVPYMALLNVAVSMPKTSPDARSRQFAIIEQWPSRPLEQPRLIVCSSAHEI